MKRLVGALLLLALFAAACGSDGEIVDTLPLSVDADVAAACEASDPDCEDTVNAGGAQPLPSAVSLSGPDDGPIGIGFGGFFYSDGEISQLCSALAESFPPQCGSTIIELDASLEVALEHVAESFGAPEDAKINIDQGIYWTDDWVNLRGVLENNKLKLE